MKIDEELLEDRIRKSRRKIKRMGNAPQNPSSGLRSSPIPQGTIIDGVLYEVLESLKTEEPEMPDIRIENLTTTPLQITDTRQADSARQEEKVVEEDRKKALVENSKRKGRELEIEREKRRIQEITSSNLKAENDELTDLLSDHNNLKFNGDFGYLSDQEKILEQNKKDLDSRNKAELEKIKEKKVSKNIKEKFFPGAENTPTDEDEKGEKTRNNFGLELSYIEKEKRRKIQESTSLRLVEENDELTDLLSDHNNLKFNGDFGYLSDQEKILEQNKKDIESRNRAELEKIKLEEDRKNALIENAKRKGVELDKKRKIEADRIKEEEKIERIKQLKKERKVRWDTIKTNIAKVYEQEKEEKVSKNIKEKFFPGAENTPTDEDEKDEKTRNNFGLEPSYIEKEEKKKRKKVEEETAKKILAESEEFNDLINEYKKVEDNGVLSGSNYLDLQQEHLDIVEEQRVERRKKEEKIMKVEVFLGKIKDFENLKQTKEDNNWLVFSGIIFETIREIIKEGTQFIFCEGVNYDLYREDENVKLAMFIFNY